MVPREVYFEVIKEKILENAEGINGTINNNNKEELILQNNSNKLMQRNWSKL
mgnify:CR=1 FL=1